VDDRSGSLGEAQRVAAHCSLKVVCQLVCQFDEFRRSPRRQPQKPIIVAMTRASERAAPRMATNNFIKTLVDVTTNP
jgi:hypothetical protein